MEIEGKAIGFRFNMLVFGRTCDIISKREGKECDINELYYRLGMTGQGNDPKIQELNDFFYCAACVYFEGEKKEIDFTDIDVADWLSYYGVEKTIEMLTASFKVPGIKNTEAPITGQKSE